jgi:hypothetical protein
MKQDFNIYLAIFCPQNCEPMAYSYAIHDSQGNEIFENTGYYPASLKNSLLSCFDLACNDLEFDLICTQTAGSEVGSISIITNYQALPHILSGNIYIDEAFKKITSFKNVLKQFEGHFTNINIQCDTGEHFVIDRSYKAINLCLTNQDSKTFYSYSYSDFVTMNKADNEGFKAMVKINKWDKIFIGKDNQTKLKIGFIKGLFASQKQLGIQATLNFWEQAFKNNNN